MADGSHWCSNAVREWRRLLALSLLLLILLGLPTAARAQQDAGATFTDSAGRFTVPIPTNWTAESREGYGLLLDPDGAIRVYVLAVDAADLDSGVAAAWRAVDPAFALPVDQVTRPPAMDGVEQSVMITYTSSPERAVLAFGDLYKGVAYVTLVDAAADAYVRRASQIQVIRTGLEIAALERVNLTGVMPRPLTPDLIAELEHHITAIMPRHDIPGAAVAIVQGDRIVYVNGFGVRELGTEAPVTADTLMMIGSTTKSMTTMMMATVIDDGRMRWDERVVQILPSFAVADPAITERLTVRNLVCACTGVPRRDLELIFNGSTLTAEAIVESLRDFQFFTEFGAAFQYSNQLVATGGYVATLAAGGHYDNLLADYEVQMQRRVFDPIGMPNTTFSFDRVRATPNHATPHGLTLAGEYAPFPLTWEEFVLPLAPSGGAWSNVRDMARYLITELNTGVAPDGRRVVSEQNLRATWEPQVNITADLRYGLGWFVDRYKGLPLIHHGGNTLGFTADAAFLPDADLGIVVLTNGQDSNPFNETVRFRLLELLYDQPMEYDTTAAFTVQESNRARAEAVERLQPLDPAAVAPYLGSYHNESLGNLTLSFSKGRLLLEVGAIAGELRPILTDTGETSYVVVDPPLAGNSFELTTDGGDPTIVLANPPDVYTFRRTPQPAAPPYGRAQAWLQ